MGAPQAVPPPHVSFLERRCHSEVESNGAALGTAEEGSGESEMAICSSWAMGEDVNTVAVWCEMSLWKHMIVRLLCSVINTTSVALVLVWKMGKPSLDFGSVFSSSLLRVSLHHVPIL